MFERRITVERHVVPAELESIPPGPYKAAILSAIDRTKLNGHAAVRVMQADESMVSLSHSSAPEMSGHFPRYVTMSPSTFSRASTTSHTPGGGGVHMTVSLETLAGLSERPGDLDGFAPVAADVARQVAKTLEGEAWTVAVTCNHGEMVHVGTTKRRPSTTLQRHIQAQLQTCVYPGCRMPSVCDIDHRRPWPQGGLTSSCELAPLCRRHHRCKDEGGWKLERTADGHQWTSPLGHRYVTPRGPP